MNNESVKNATVENVRIDDSCGFELIKADVIIDGVRYSDDNNNGYVEYIDETDGHWQVDRTSCRYGHNNDCNILSDAFEPAENDTEGAFDAYQAMSDLDEIIEEILNQN